MNRTTAQLILLTGCIAVLMAAASLALADESQNLLKNPDFGGAVTETGRPSEWAVYGGVTEHRYVSVAEDGTERVLVLTDNDSAGEIGVTQKIVAQAGETYEARVTFRAAAGRSTVGSFVQMRFLPGNEFKQASLYGKEPGDNTVAVKMTAPEGTAEVIIYVYSHAAETPKVMVSRVELVSGVEPPPPPPPPVPEPIPPQYEELKNLRLETILVGDGQAHISIVAPATERYDEQATKLQAAIGRITGVTVPIIRDDVEAAAVPINGNLICLGNRSTSKTIEQLYNFYYCLLDLKYPGPEGYVVRTLHDPFGDGNNVIFAGGSDDIGVTLAVDALINVLENAGGTKGNLSVGRLMTIKLGKGVVAPDDVRQMETWEASKGYGSVGYFGWCSISKEAAMYYMTGREEHARKFLRLAFPDEEAMQEIIDIDGERIENKDDPLAGFYHYNAHMAILFWDLIEESDVFTDEERLKVTNAFARQLNHRKDEGVYRLQAPLRQVSSRHGQWSAISLYCLGRYFEKNYPDPIWAQCVRGSEMAFRSLHEYAYVMGESDNLFWYCTGTAPILTYMTLTGDRVPLKAGTLQKQLRAQEILLPGGKGHWSLNSASLGYLNKAAYLTQDGRWITYRDRTGVDTDVFRLGQSFWPEEHIKPAMPTDLVNRWTVDPLSFPAWEDRNNGFSPEESFYVASFRSRADDGGDFILVDGYNGASRNPYHNFAILELRLNGTTLLSGYRNGVLTRADGMVEPSIAMNAALKWNDVVGQTVGITADIPQTAYADWQRTMLQRIGKYAIVVDDFRFRTDADNMSIQTLWEGSGETWDASRNTLLVQGTGARPLAAGWLRLGDASSKFTGDPGGENGMALLDSLGIMLLRSRQTGDWLEMEFDVERPLKGEVSAEFLKYADRGIISVAIDGEVIVPEFDLYSQAAEPVRVSLGEQELAAGRHRLRMEVVQPPLHSDKAYIGFAGLVAKPETAPATEAAPRFEIHPGDVVDAHPGPYMTLEWTGPVKEGQRAQFFTVIGEAVDDELACLRLADNAAALALPQPALLVAGEYGQTSAEVAIIAQDHLFGRRLTRAAFGPATILLATDKPIDADWDFTSGVLNVVAPEPTVITLACKDALSLRLGDVQLCDASGSLAEFTVPEGKSTVTGAKLGGECVADLTANLTAMLSEGQNERTRLMAEAKAAGEIEAPALETIFDTDAETYITNAITIPTDEGDITAASTGKIVELFGADGGALRSFEADGEIRVLHWWPEYKLLLAGCRDEQVIAFTLDGDRKWVFTSVMDPAVFRAAKTYWFKTAPGHEGIHGLYTGEFFNDEQQCFVGSACTLEAIDANGQLVKRMPVFWGPGHVFQIVDVADGSKNLLVSRQPTDSERLAIINNKAEKIVGWGYYGVPSGHTYVSSWAGKSRFHIFYVDMDGDGTKEVVSEINGVWNRVTVWSGAGTPLYSASFGPGEATPYRNIRDIDIVDLDGDGKQEIVLATSSALVVALDNECNRLWSCRLPSAPTVLAAVAFDDNKSPSVVVGCTDGQVFTLDNAGEIVGKSTVDGVPTSISTLQTDDGPAVVLSTSNGNVKAFR